MASQETRFGRLQICYDPAKDVLEVWLGNSRDGRNLEHEEGLTVWKELRTPRAMGLRIEDYENNFRALPDISWLRAKGLPADLLNYVLDRPCLVPAPKRIS